MIPTGCLTDDALAAILDGRAGPEELAAVHRHLGTCPACMTLLGALGRSQQDLALARTWDRLPLASEGAALPPSFGEFRLLRLLGRGAMGAVYLAEDTLLGRQVAIKFI